MIREATLDDIPVLIGMGERFAAACGLGEIAPYDPESMAATFRHLIESDDGILLMSPHGAAGGLVHPAYWNREHRHGQELFWWVEPGSRGGEGIALFHALELAAKSKGARSWAMITLERIKPEVTGRLYQRRGYRPLEHSYVRAL